MGSIEWLMEQTVEGRPGQSCADSARLIAGATSTPYNFALWACVTKYPRQYSWDMYGEKAYKAWLSRAGNDIPIRWEKIGRFEWSPIYEQPEAPPTAPPTPEEIPPYVPEAPPTAPPEEKKKKYLKCTLPLLDKLPGLPWPEDLPVPPLFELVDEP